MKTGFHSLVQVLLEAGAIIEPAGWDSPVMTALNMRRLDLIRLLVDHGVDPKAIPLSSVFHTWDTEIMQYFIDLGADIETGMPFAQAFIDRVKTALKAYKACREQRPELQQQIDVALRHHCKEGNKKWIALMLWAGADPHAPGASEPGESADDGWTAVEYAAAYNHFDVFEMRQLKLSLKTPRVEKLISSFCEEGGLPYLRRLLQAGVATNDQKNGGCSAIQNGLVMLDCLAGLNSLSNHDRGYDSHDARARLRGMELLAKYGAKWAPEDKSDLNRARKALVQMMPDYTLEFVWIMSKYKACDAATIRSLVSTPAMKRHMANDSRKLQELLAKWE